MLGWIALIGRTISFALEKLASKAIDLTTDQRRKSARQFLALYQAVEDLEVLSKEVMVELRDMNQMADPSLAREWLRDVSIAVDETSQRFFESTRGLRTVLEIFDPVLATTIGTLEADKFSFLLVAARGFQGLGNRESPEIKYTYPSQKGVHLDLDQAYQWHADRYPLDPTQPAEWPDDVLSSFVTANPNIESDRLVLSEPDSMLVLLDCWNNIFDHFP